MTGKNPFQGQNVVQFDTAGYQNAQNNIANSTLQKYAAISDAIKQGGNAISSYLKQSQQDKRTANTMESMFKDPTLRDHVLGIDEDTANRYIEMGKNMSTADRAGFYSTVMPSLMKYKQDTLDQDQKLQQIDAQGGYTLAAAGVRQPKVGGSGFNYTGFRDQAMGTPPSGVGPAVGASPDSQATLPTGGGDLGTPSLVTPYIPGKLQSAPLEPFIMNYQSPMYGGIQ